MKTRRPTRNRGNKADAQLDHARRRFMERHDLAITNDELRHLARQITRGETRKIPPTPGLGWESNRVTHHLVTVQGRPFVVVYDKHRKTIVTVLP